LYLQVKTYLPVAESFGFTGELRAATSGQAFPAMIFDHWEPMSDDPLKDGTRTNDLVQSIRKRKGLKQELVQLSEYEDKL
jgi:elongation factor 2